MAVKSQPLRVANVSGYAKKPINPFPIKPMKLGPRKQRSKIGPLKQDMVDAILSILKWISKPTDDRSIFYQLLNDPPFKNTNTREKFHNSKRCYNDLCELLTRMRLEGTIPWEWIADETRPVTIWDVHRDPATFISAQMRKFLTGYYRDLLQSQPNYIEVLVEKNTVASRLRDVCGKYCVPMTSGRGFCSSPPRHDLLERYQKSGKDKMVLLIISDLDPAGMFIAKSFARSMRDDFDCEQVYAIKVALTDKQLLRYKIPHGEKVKKSDKMRGPAFIKRYGNFIYELEALPDGTIPKLLDRAIRSVLDLDAYNYEVRQERIDAAKIKVKRKAVITTLRQNRNDR